MKQVQEVALDMSIFMETDVPFERRMALCERLGLINTLKHDGKDYARLTDDGRVVLATLMRMMVDYAMDPEDKIVQQ
jgi:hypothetical protein